MIEPPEILAGRVKSRLLPYKLLASTLEWLVERLPRRIIGVTLKPSNDVEVIDVGKGEFNATGNSPSFEMVFELAPPQSGWYYLEAALVRNNGNREASISCNSGRKSKESIILPIPANRRGSVREVFFCLPTSL